MLNIQKMMTLSMAHISPQTRIMLDAYADNGTFYGLAYYRKDEYGYFIYINEAEFRDSGMRLEQAAKDLWTVVDFALACDCTILCLDSDEETIPNLTVYQ